MLGGSEPTIPFQLKLSDMDILFVAESLVEYHRPWWNVPDGKIRQYAANIHAWKTWVAAEQKMHIKQVDGDFAVRNIFSNN